MPKILVIDDSAFSRRQIVKILSEADYEIVEAADGQAGLDAVKEHTPDAVVTDLLMPVMSGIDFLKELRSKGSSLPVLVHTADIQDSVREECKQLNCFAFINKPCNKDDMLTLVEKMVSHKNKGAA